jgi:2-oxoglutarate ferredoxin oxidoreductase subunit gamma
MSAQLNDPVQVRFSGAGGQGLITAGVILAEAAMLEGRNVVQTQTYGPEARLGSSKSEVIISSARIAYPEVTVPDVLLCMSQEAARRYLARVHSETMVIVDSANVPADIATPGKVIRLAITDAAIKIGSKVVANTLALCALNTLVPLVSRDALLRAIVARVPAKFRDLNQRAAEAGEALALQARAACAT